MRLKINSTGRIRNIYHRGHREHRVKNNELTEKVIGCAIEVHKTLGPGLLETAYEQCLAREFALSCISFKTQVPLPVEYKGVYLDCGYRIDMLIEESLMLELKSVEKVAEIHKAQLLTYMKLASVKIGLLINFNVKLLKDGIERFIL
ncbi:MAG: GxxExxY protein [Candidatus Omnitrophica bacterium]|nr:GxxExxY protein [Candidatus Omnitrophota bacterium]